MKPSAKIVLTFLLAVVMCMTAPLAKAVLVAEKAPTKVAPKAPAKVVKGRELVVTHGGVGDVLREAYADLHRADHDYSGHRARAMRQIEAAAKLLGEKLEGDGRGGETQGVSDEQLHAAQNLLEGARGRFSGQVLVHINNAINQLTIALKLK